MQYHLPRSDRFCGLKCAQEPRCDQGPQFCILVVEIKAFIGAMDTDPSIVTGQRSLGSSDPVASFRAKCGVRHEILQFDVALRIKEPGPVVGNFGDTKTCTNLEGWHWQTPFLCAFFSLSL
jgi:hypothetical protein